eukprot:COSAG06_NODE_2728_length_6381_cov_2.712034_3_plen_45_part_00
MVKEKAYQVDQNALAEYLLRRRTFVVYKPLRFKLGGRPVLSVLI